MKEGMICFGFDDGFKTDLTVALQEQLNRGMTPKGTSFIISSYTGSTRLTNAEKLELVNHGWDLQCHSHTHTLDGPLGGLTGLTAEQLHEEMQLVNKHFEEDLGLPAPEYHSYPGGANNELIRNIFSRYRKGMRTTTIRYIDENVDMQRIPTGDYSDFKKTIDHCIKYKLAATFYPHELDTQEKIDHYCAALDYIKKTGIRMVTFKEMIEELEKINS